MSLSAFDTFKVTHERGKVMMERSVKLAAAVQKLAKKPSVEEYNHVEYVPDLGRSGIVTAVAALDRYFTTKFAECVVPVLKHEGPSDGLLKILANAGLDLKGALGLLHMERPHRRINTLIRQHLSEFTTQRFIVIDELFRSLGIVDLSLHAQNKSKRKKLKVSIEGLIRRRHVIVHEGDVDKRGKLKRLDPYDAVKRIENIRVIVECAEEIVNSRLKKCKASKKGMAKKSAGKKTAVTKARKKKAVTAEVETVLESVRRAIEVGKQERADSTE